VESRRQPTFARTRSGGFPGLIRTSLLLSLLALALPATAQATFQQLGRLSPSEQTGQAPQIGVDQNGNAVMVYAHFDGTDANNTCCFRIEARTRSSAGVLGPPTLISAVGKYATQPAIAVDPNGNAVFAWVVNNGLNDIIQTRRLSSTGSLSAIQTLSTAGQNASEPQVGIDSTGNAYYVWERLDGSNPGAGCCFRVQIRKRTPTGTLNTVQTLSTAGQVAFSPQIGVDSAGDAVVTWAAFTGAHDDVQIIRRAASGSLSSIQTVSTKESTQPQIAVRPSNGDAVVTWVEFDGQTDRIQGIARAAAGTLSTVQTLSASGQYAEEPQVSVDTNGNAIFIWERLDTTTSALIETRTRTQAGTLGTTEVHTATGQKALAPQIGFDSSGNAVFTWGRFDGTSTTCCFLIQTRRRTSAGALSAIQNLSLAGQNGKEPQIAVAPNGDAVYTWSRFDGKYQRVQARQRLSAGTLAGLQTVSSVGPDGFTAQTAVAPNGSAVFTWMAFDGTHNLIQARTSTATGGLSPVQTLSDTTQNASQPQVGVDSSGNAVFVWKRSDGTNTRIEARTRSSTGTLGTVQVLSAAGQNADVPQVAVDPNGNAVFTWTRSDGTNTRVEAVARSSGGTLSPVQVLSAAGQNATQPQVGIDSTGNAVFTWTRSDGTNTRIEAITRSSAGTFGGVQLISVAGQNASEPQVAVDPIGDSVFTWKRSDGTNTRIETYALPAGGAFGAAASQTADRSSVAPAVVDPCAGAPLWPGATNGNDTVNGTAGDDVIFTGDGNDTIHGLGGNDTLCGGNGADILDGGAGADYMSGGAGTDTATYSTQTASVTASIDGVANDGTAGEGDNVQTDVENLNGGTGADTLTGSAADNSLKGGNGADVLNGLGGVDTATYAGRTSAVTVDIDNVADDGNASDGPVGARDNVKTDVENLIGTSGADTLTGSTGDNTLDGGNGADVLSGLAGTDTVTYASRTAAVSVAIDGVANDGNSSDGSVGARDNVMTDVENLTGGTAADTLTGSSADNTLDGGKGADILGGLTGIDTVTYAGRNTGVIVTIDGVANDGDASDGPAGARDNVLTDVENLTGGRGADSLTGSTAANSLTGGLGADTLRGSDGNDELFANDRVTDTQLDCGNGTADIVHVDQQDPASVGCETILSPVQVLSEAGQNASQAQVAIDSNGNAVYAWTRFDGTTPGTCCFVVQDRARAAAGPLSAVQTLSAGGSPPGANAGLPQLAVDSSGNAVIVWRFDGTDKRIQSRTRASDGTLGTLEPISNATLDADLPQVGVNATGKAFVVWQRHDGKKSRIEGAVGP
jgi:Ca2+-binding RTX toxin-like protein